MKDEAPLNFAIPTFQQFKFKHRFSYLRFVTQLCTLLYIPFFTPLFLVKLPSGTKASSWIKMNAGQTGFYRVNYENENWNKLVHQLNASHQVI